jgi:hypothetical protein
MMNKREAAANATDYVGGVLLLAGRPLSSSEIVRDLEKLPRIRPEVRVSLGLEKAQPVRARYINRHLKRLQADCYALLIGRSPRTSKWIFTDPRDMQRVRPRLHALLAAAAALEMAIRAADFRP